MAEHTYIYESPEYSLFIYSGSVYYRGNIILNNRPRVVLISMDINDSELNYHSSSFDRVPDSILQEMHLICHKLCSDRTALITADLRQRRVTHVIKANSYVEYATRVVDSEKGECVHYDHYRIKLVGTEWQLETPYYFSQYLKTKRPHGVFKLYSSTKGGLYFNIGKKRTYLSEFTKTF
jgi:hypothetical protein